jgi:methylated-DNA-[protein]-cysteine S-methyltransferase
MPYFTTLTSPVGELFLASDGTALTGVSFEPPADVSSGAMPSVWTRLEAPFGEVLAQIRAYFDGRRQVFELPVAVAGTAFQKSVWAALATIPFGETRSYAAVAAQLGQPGAARAVGLAAGRNPIPLMVPCHRMIGTDGTLIGYVGGLDRKRRLLEHEAAVAAGRFS